MSYFHQPGTLYLLHFSRKLPGGGRHYLGWSADFDVQPRVDRHLAGDGAKIVAAALQRKIKVSLVRTWSGTRKTEKQLKQRHGHARLCPLCRVAELRRRADLQAAARQRERVQGPKLTAIGRGSGDD